MSKPKLAYATTVGSAFAEKFSFGMALLLCIGVLAYGLLPGLLAICLGVLLASALVGHSRKAGPRLRPTMAAGLVIFIPIVVLGVFLANAKGIAFNLIPQYQALLQHLAGTVLEIRQKLPPDLATHLPDELLGAQAWLADYLQSRAKALTGIGTAGLQGALLAYVGIVVGALMVGTQRRVTTRPLPNMMRQRATLFMDAFRQIVVAQFWIATFNATCTALFLLLALPLLGISMPYAGSLIAFTFIAGLIPIVGNLLCNGVLTLAGVSVSPAVGLACLVFLVVIHKSEILINAKVIGARTQTTTWELLTVMFVADAIFGLPGLVAAPLFYAYAKKELQLAELI
jgi:predicted PurR-regulated permease PerM